MGAAIAQKGDTAASLVERARADRLARREDLLDAPVPPPPGRTATGGTPGRSGRNWPRRSGSPGPAAGIMRPSAASTASWSGASSEAARKAASSSSPSPTGRGRSSRRRTRTGSWTGRGRTSAAPCAWRTCTQYQPGQYLLLCPGCRQKDAPEVVERLGRRFRQENRGRYRLRCRVLEVKETPRRKK